MTEKKPPKKTAKRPAATKSIPPAAEDFSSELRALRDRIEVLARTLDPSGGALPARSERLCRLGESLEQIVQNARRTKLDREKLLAIASAIAAIARIFGETLADSSDER